MTGLPLRHAVLVAAVAVGAGCALPAPGPAPAPPAPGDTAIRWYVAVRASTGREPVAERHRLGPPDTDGLRRLEVVRGPAFSALDPPGPDAPRVVGGRLRNAVGLWSVPLDDAGRPAAPALLEVPAQGKPGDAWAFAAIDGSTLEARVVGSEPIDLPGRLADTVALRVEHRTPSGPVMVTWYDAGHIPVRAEIRSPEGRLIEARAILPTATPTSADGRAALEWARRVWIRSAP